jgi:hypothetical protein
MRARVPWFGCRAAGIHVNVHPKVLMKLVCTHVLTALSIAASLVACGDDSAPQVDADADTATPSDEQCPANLEPLRDGANGSLQTDAKADLSVRVVSAQALPPARDFNDWTIAITNANGDALPNAQVTWACAWMPVHGHGSNPKALEKLDDGRFELKRQNLSMYGGWQIKLWVTADGGQEYVPPTSSGVLNGNVCQPSNGTTGEPNIVFDICVPRMRGG